MNCLKNNKPFNVYDNVNSSIEYKLHIFVLEKSIENVEMCQTDKSCTLLEVFANHLK